MNPWFIHWARVTKDTVVCLVRRESASRRRLVTRGRIARANTARLRYSLMKGRFINDADFYRVLQSHNGVDNVAKLSDRAQQIAEAKIIEAFERD